MGDVTSSSVDPKTGEIVVKTEKMDYTKEPGEEEPVAGSEATSKPVEPAEGAEKPATDAAAAETGKEEKPDEADDGKDDPGGEEPAKPEDQEAAAGEEGSKEASEAAGETEEKPGEAPKKPKKKGRMERRVDKLTREKGILEEQIAGLRAGQPKPAQVVAAPAEGKAEEEKPPKEEDFETYGEYVDARSTQAARKEYARLEQEKAKTASEAESKRALSEHFKRVDSASARYEDWDEAKQQLPPIPPAVTNLIIEDEAGPDILYHLAKNPEFAAQLWKMSEIKAVAEVGKLAASFTPDPKATKPPVPTGNEVPVSNAPKPTKPVGGSGASKYKLALDDPRVGPAEFARRREAGEA